jgi:glycerol uptake facilitator-like aquaporin
VDTRLHWPEYLGEAALLGAFMLVACVAGVLLDHPAAAAVRAIPDPFARRSLFGLAMGATAIAIIYSPIGKRSGAHINPSVTLAFLRLGKVKPRDDALEVWIGPLAVGYIDLRRRQLVPYGETSRPLEEAIGARTKVSPMLPV